MTGLEPSDIRLEFLPLDRMLLHEEDDPLRVKQLALALGRDGKLRNPPIVSDYGGHCIVLDGATRITALREMGVQDVPVQIVDYDSEHVELSVWHHVIVGMAPNRLLANLADVDEITVEPVDAKTSRRMLEHREIVACLLMTNGQEFAILCGGDVNRQANLLCRLVATYRGKAEVHRIAVIDLTALGEQYPGFSAVVGFPCYRPAEIVQIAINGDKVPMGITRHLISGRVLGLDIPLEMLKGTSTREEKNAWLTDTIRRRLRANKVRLYQESVFVFDE